jgi:DNA-binding NtrC family response regulator
VNAKAPSRTILIVDENIDFVQRLEDVFLNHRDHKYTILWRRTVGDAIHELEQNSDVDVVLLEYFLPDQTGVDLVRKMQDLKIQKPVVFLSANKDCDIVIEIMKFRVRDYLVKDEFSLDRLPSIISRICDEDKIREESSAREITRQRIAAMKELIDKIVSEIEQPTMQMQHIIHGWSELAKDKPYARFVDIITEHVSRIMQKIGKLRSLNTDKTVKYIKDIRMIDLS